MNARLKRFRIPLTPQERLRDLLYDLRMNQRQAGAAIGISSQTLSGYISGRARIPKYIPLALMCLRYEREQALAKAYELEQQQAREGRGLARGRAPGSTPANGAGHQVTQDDQVLPEAIPASVSD